MEHKIRLAEAMGILRGPDLNPVQVKALVFLQQEIIAHRHIDRSEGRFEAVKLAVTSNPNLVPDFDALKELHSSGEEEVEEIDKDFNVDDTQGSTLRFTDSEVDFSEVSALIGLVQVDRVEPSFIEDALAPYSDDDDQEGWV